MYTPIFPYNKEQIILTSDRVVLNSKLDSIFLFADKVISLSSNEGVHINTDEGVYVNGKEIKLGLDAKEPIVKGNELKNLLDNLLTTLSNVGILLSTATDSNGNPIPQVVTAGKSLQKSAQRIKTTTKKDSVSPNTATDDWVEDEDGNFIQKGE